MKHLTDLLIDGNIRKSFTGTPTPLEGYAVRLSNTIEKINDGLTFNEVDAAIEGYKTRHFDELNQMGAFYDVTLNDEGITMSVVVYILDKQLAINFAKKYNHELN
jgi:hypothetical protein